MTTKLNPHNPKSKKRVREISVTRRLTQPVAPIKKGELIEHTQLPVEDIMVGAYQRLIRPQWVNAIVRSFDPALFEPIHVALREDNNYYVVDGQHRLEAAKALKMAKVAVILHLDMKEKNEASLFVSLQERRLGLSQVSRYHAGLIAKDPVSLRIQSVLNQAHYKMATVSTAMSYTLACPAALTYIIEQYDDAMLLNILRLITKAWGGNKEALKASLIKGLALFLHERTTILESPPMYDKFAVRLHSLKPTDILLRASVIRHTLGCSPHRALAHVFSDVANMGRGIGDKERE